MSPGLSGVINDAIGSYQAVLCYGVIGTGSHHGHMGPSGCHQRLSTMSSGFSEVINDVLKVYQGTLVVASIPLMKLCMKV